MDFRILGPLEASANGERLALGSHKQRALLAMLLVNAEQVVSRARLIEALWADEPPGSARHAVGVNVSRLRKTLGASHVGDSSLVTRAPGYVLHVERSSDSRSSSSSRSRNASTPNSHSVVMPS